MTITPDILLNVNEISVWFPVKRGLLWSPFAAREYVRAVNNVSLQLRAGDILGIVGESGCGKSTLARTIVRLEQPTRGSIWIDGYDIGALNQRRLRKMRPRMQMIFQDPYASLNPRMTVFDALAEPLRVHKRLRGALLRDAAFTLMDKVGLARRFVRKYPHEFSGGQRQRIAIARALAQEPQLLIADEPVSALDVSVQAQIINLLQAIHQETGMAMIFISHDLSVVRHIAQRINVMYLGHVVESGPAEAVFAHPQHPYTQVLLEAAPIADPEREIGRKQTIHHGEPPSPIHPPPGCPYHPRCIHARPECAAAMPEHHLCGNNHAAACLLLNN